MIAVGMTDLQIDIEDFYITIEHRHAELVITGGNDGESIQMQIANFDDADNGHFKTWGEIASGTNQSLIFNDGKINLVDNCITSRCNYAVEIEIIYHNKRYALTLNINTTE